MRQMQLKGQVSQTSLDINTRKLILAKSKLEEISNYLDQLSNISPEAINYNSMPKKKMLLFDKGSGKEIPNNPIWHWCGTKLILEPFVNTKNVKQAEFKLLELRKFLDQEIDLSSIGLSIKDFNILESHKFIENKSQYLKDPPVKIWFGFEWFGT